VEKLMPILTSTPKLKTLKMQTSNKIDFDKIRSGVVDFFTTHFGKISADTMGWLAAIALHAATIPTLLALLTGMTDTTPSVDVVLFMWLGLVFLFGRAVVLRDLLNIVTIGLGFVIQAVLMALILFK
jgi:hypothetical protein